MTCLRVLFSFHAVCGKTRAGCNCRFGCDRILEPGVSIIQYVIDVFTYWEKDGARGGTENRHRTGFAVRPSRTTVHTDPLSGRAEQPLGGQLI